MAYNSTYTGEELDALLQKIKTATVATADAAGEGGLTPETPAGSQDGSMVLKSDLTWGNMDSRYLPKGGSETYTPTGENDPATKSYVDAQVEQAVSASKLKKINKGADFIAYARKCLESYRDNVPAFVFFATQYQFSPTDIRKIGIDWNRIIKSELTALSTIRDDGSKAKLRKDLLDDGKIFSFIKTADEDDVESIIPLVLANEGLDSSEKDRIKARIKERLPQVQFDSPKPQVQTVKAPEIKAASGFLCTEESYNRKTEELKDINTNQIPEILKEINFARELGDLRENSEYQYAKEHKRELERRIGELNNDLSTVRIMHPEDVVDGLIGFGTEVKLHDNLEDKDITYTFMGRWESKPEEGIIDINAPLGKMLINHRTGDNIVFDINDRKFDFTVLSIRKVEF